MTASTEVSPTTAVAARSELPKIHAAARSGNTELLKKLVTRENVNAPAEDGSFALQWAASGNHWKATKFLLDTGADPNLKGPMEATALHWCTRNGLVYMAQLLISRGADTAAIDSQAYTILHVAVHSSNVLMVIYLLHLDPPADPNARDALGRTPLHWAAYQGDHLSVKSLLRAGADPNIQDSEGFSPLHWSLVSREPTSIETIVAAKSNLGLKTDAGKSCWVIAEEMDSRQEWHDALVVNDRRPESGIPIPRRIKPWAAKLLLFVLPALLIPAFIHILILSNTVPFALGFSLLLAYLAHRVSLRYLYPAIDRSSHAILKSPVFAGIYNGMYVWVLLVFPEIAPSATTAHPILLAIFLLLAIAILVFYSATVFLDPGSIHPGKIGERRKHIFGLMDKGLYDGQHFCALTWVLKPARAHYSKIAGKVIARFDHYCPWTYNCVGLRNHRAFILYVFCLAIDVWIYIYFYYGYLTTLDENLWVALGKTQFSAYFSLGIAVQGAWISLLAVTQSIQIARGLTTAEFGHQDKATFSSLPRDHPCAGAGAGVDAGAPAPAPAPAPAHTTCFTTCLKVLGVHQAMVTSRSVKRKRSSGYSLWTNCGDFWCTGWNLFNPSTQGRLGGKQVDYYTDMDPPQAPAPAPASEAENSLRILV